jgi:hypothetical protein
MFIGNGLDGLQFNNNPPLNNQIRVKITKDCAIFVKNLNRMLLLDIQTGFTQSVRQGILVDFLQVTMPGILMNRKRCFANKIA